MRDVLQPRTTNRSDRILDLLQSPSRLIRENLNQVLIVSILKRLNREFK